MVKSCGKDGFSHLSAARPFPFGRIIKMWSCAGLTDSRQGRDAGAFGKCPGTVARSTCASHHVHPHQLQNEEPVTEAQCRAACQGPGARRSTSLRSGASLSLVPMNLRTCRLQRGWSPRAVGSTQPSSWPRDKWRALHSRASALPPLHTHQ